MRQKSNRSGMHWIFDREAFVNLRKSMGYTQTEFAKLLNVTTNTVYAYESGGKMPTSNKVEDMATILDVSRESIAIDREVYYRRIDDYNSIYNSIKRELDDKYAIAIRTAYSNIKKAVDAKDYNTIIGEKFVSEVNQSQIANDIIKYAIPIAASVMNIYQAQFEDVQ